MSIDASIRRQFLNTKIYRTQMLHEHVEELPCRLCTEKQETLSHVLCGCSHITQSLYKLVMTKCFALSIMLSLKNMDSINPITLLHGTCNLIPNQAKVLWDIPRQLEKCPKNGANKPDISILDKKNKE